MAENMENADEIIRRAYDAFNRGDFDAATENIHPEIVWNRVADVEQPVHGLEAARSLMKPEVFTRQRNEIHAIDVIGDFILVDTSFQGVGAASGIELTQRGYHLWRIKGGMAIEFSFFWDRDEAVRAAETG